MKIAIVVHGRFHAFHLARALIARGHEVTVFTNYPKWAARKFGLPSRNVRAFRTHALLDRAASRAGRWVPSLRMDSLLHRMFGRWAARQVSRSHWCLLHVFSGVAEETLRMEADICTKTLVRASSHIRAQDQLLAEEETRVGRRVERPSHWMIKREEREYALADRIVVVSSFARQTFETHAVPKQKLFQTPLGVDVQRFRPHSSALVERCRRIRAGEPLRILTVGSLTPRKGMLDLQQVVASLRGEPFQFRFVGKAERWAQQRLTGIGSLEFIPKQFELELPQQYLWGDIFLFPTIEDGFPIVLAQAFASALPIITTTNCSGPDLVREGETGWVVPIRRPDMIVARLRECHMNREALASMVERIYREFKPRDWDEVAQEFEHLCENCTCNARSRT
jgi:glycosyltransferase involved in cell wall biosynthesis